MNDYNYERKCINCLLITGFLCGTLQGIGFIIGLIVSISDSEWVGVGFFFFVICFRIVELTVQYLLYGAVNTNDWAKMKLLIKTQLGMFLFVYLLFLVLSFLADDGKPVDVIMSFIIGGIITAIWFWYLFKYIGNGKILQQKNMVAIKKSQQPQLQ